MRSIQAVALAADAHLEEQDAAFISVRAAYLSEYVILLSIESYFISQTQLRLEIRYVLTPAFQIRRERFKVISSLPTSDA